MRQRENKWVSSLASEGELKPELLPDEQYRTTCCTSQCLLGSSVRTAQVLITLQCLGIYTQYLLLSLTLTSTKERSLISKSLTSDQNTRLSVLGHIHHFHKQAAGHRLWVCSGRNYCRKHSESQPNLRTSYYTMDNLQIKETLFTCWLFFQLSSQYICCAIAVLGSWEKNFLYKQEGLFSLQESFQKGCFVSFRWCTALSANPRTLQNDFDSKGYRERDVWNPILQNMPFTTEFSVLVERGFAKWENSVPIVPVFRTQESLKEVSHPDPATGTQVSQSALLG